ncbi:hypothetical protein BH10PLA2_BH10PLA2_35240 [soil metagenome]
MSEPTGEHRARWAGRRPATVVHKPQTRRLTPLVELWHSVRRDIRTIAPMTRKLTISIDDRVYDGLHAVIGRGNIGKFLKELARPFVLADSLSAAYAEMAADKVRDDEANEWCESLAGDQAPACAGT